MIDLEVLKKWLKDFQQDNYLSEDCRNNIAAANEAIENLQTQLEWAMKRFSEAFLAGAQYQYSQMTGKEMPEPDIKTVDDEADKYNTENKSAKE